MMKDRQAWDWGRFLETVTYFESVPFLSQWPCLKRLILGRDASFSAPMNPTTGTILLVGTPPTVREALIQHLGRMQYPVRILLSPMESMPTNSTGVEYYATTETPPPDKMPTLLHHVQTVVYGSDDFRLPLWIDATAQYVGTGSETLLMDFRVPSEALKANWGAVDDVVMGGVSSSGMRWVEGRAIFAGQVSTANSGGFASVRDRNFDPPLDLSDYAGIQLRVKGDGQRYKLILRCDGRWDGVSYCYSFDTVAGEWLTVSVPFQALRPVFRAKTLTDVGPFDASRTYSFQFMLSKFEYDGALNLHFTPGAFALEIATIHVYGGTPTPKLILLRNTPLSLETEVNLRSKNLPYQVLNLAQDPRTLAEEVSQLLGSSPVV